MRKIISISILIMLSFLDPVKGNGFKAAFPVSDRMKLQVQFWVNVFSRYSIYEKIVHDASHPLRIYAVIDFRDFAPNGKLSPERRAAILRREKEKIKMVLLKLSSRTFSMEELSPEEARIYRLFGKNPNRKVFAEAIRKIHIQGGMKEAFIEGLNRSGRYLGVIKNIFKNYDLPEELIYLPHIESSFNPYAHSRSGAMGIWQFTRNTGRAYLKIRNDVDERKDPILSSEAAAKLLKYYYRKLKSWPLAVTAYNHGVGGISRAVQKTKTRDIDAIILNYRSRRFGFASKNFYAEFIAAVRVAKYPWKYFDDYDYDEPYRFRTIQLDQQKNLRALLKEYNVTEDEIRRLNPALRPVVLQSEKPIPKGYALRLPADESNADQLARSDIEETKENSNKFGYLFPGQWFSFLIKPKSEAGRISSQSESVPSRQDEPDYTKSEPEGKRDFPVLVIREEEIESYEIKGTLLWFNRKKRWGIMPIGLKYPPVV